MVNAYNKAGAQKIRNQERMNTADDSIDNTPCMRKVKQEQGGGKSYSSCCLRKDGWHTFSCPIGRQERTGLPQGKGQSRENPIVIGATPPAQKETIQRKTVRQMLQQKRERKDEWAEDRVEHTPEALAMIAERTEATVTKGKEKRADTPASNTPSPVKEVNIYEAREKTERGASKIGVAGPAPRGSPVSATSPPGWYKKNRQPMLKKGEAGERETGEREEEHKAQAPSTPMGGEKTEWEKCIVRAFQCPPIGGDMKRKEKETKKAWEEKFPGAAAKIQEVRLDKRYPEERIYHIRHSKKLTPGAIAQQLQFLLRWMGKSGRCMTWAVRGEIHEVVIETWGDHGQGA